jgi:hypothetical protein
MKSNHTKKGGGVASGIRWTLDKACKEFGANRNTLTRLVRVAGIEPGSDGKFSTAQIASAIFGDKASEDLRKVREEADKLALHNAKERGALVDVEAVFRTFQGVFISMRQTILGSELSDREKDELLNNLRALSYDEAKRNGIAETIGEADGDTDATAAG